MVCRGNCLRWKVLYLDTVDRVSIEKAKSNPYLSITRENSEGEQVMTSNRVAKFCIGQVVRHRYFPFRGVIFDVDAEFNNSEEWYRSIPEKIRPDKDQPFYHLLAENEDSAYVAYVSEQNLLADATGEPVGHPAVGELFGDLNDGFYHLIKQHAH